MLKSPRRRKRVPIGGRLASLAAPAWLRAGHVDVLSAARAGELVAGGPDEAPVGALGGEADGVVDVAGLHLVEPEEAGQDRQAVGVGRRPPLGAQLIGLEVEDG